jgi:hypothetical protein
VSISHRHEEPKAQGRAPGPGEYDPRLPGSPYAQVSLKFRHAGGAGQPPSGAARGEVEALPGPHEFADGPLRHGALRGGKGKTIGAKLRVKTQQEQTPAPGQYEVGPVSTLGAATAGLQ